MIHMHWLLPIKGPYVETHLLNPNFFLAFTNRTITHAELKAFSLLDLVRISYLSLYAAERFPFQEVLQQLGRARTEGTERALVRLDRFHGNYLIPPEVTTNLCPTLLPGHSRAATASSLAPGEAWQCQTWNRRQHPERRAAAKRPAAQPSKCMKNTQR